MKRTKYLLAISTIAMLGCLQVLLSPGAAKASFCSPREDGLKDAEVVFSGKVLNISHDNGDDIVLFRVTSIWRGVSGPRVVVNTGDRSARDCGTGHCGYKFKVGNSYLVFGYVWGPPYEPTNRLITDICSRTELLSVARPDLEGLGPSRLPVAGSGLAGDATGLLSYLLMALASVTVGFGLRWLSGPTRLVSTGENRWN